MFCIKIKLFIFFTWCRVSLGKILVFKGGFGWEKYLFVLVGFRVFSKVFFFRFRGWVLFIFLVYNEMSGIYV